MTRQQAFVASIIELQRPWSRDTFLEGIDEKREEPNTEHDMVFENVALCKQHGLLTWSSLT